MSRPRSYAERRAAIARMSREFRERMAKADVEALSEVEVPDIETASDDDRSMTGDRSTQDARSSFGFATFSQLYESADKRFCVYEDKWGHITSVNAARFV